MKTEAMSFPDRRASFRRPVALTTEPDLARNKNGGLRLVLLNRHPHERVRIYVGPRKACRV